MNRAMDGDTVLIELDQVEKWKQEAVETKNKGKYDNQKAVE
jgi:exoribonuclease R